MIDANGLFDRIERVQPRADASGPIVVPQLVLGWLAAGPAVFADADRDRVDALCRQIDVRRKVSVVYDHGWKRREPETPVSPETMAGVVAVLLANAGPIDGPIGPADAADDGGWGLKCANSALKALELRDELPEAASLRAWALAVLDHRTGTDR